VSLGGRRVSLAELTDRNAVLRALEEFDRLGPDQFLRTYGFKPARTYFLRHGGRDYDSKAIADVAHGIQHRGGQPLPASAFSGDEATVARKLRSLGFEVIQRSAQDPSQASGRVVQERARRDSMWASLRAAGGPDGLSPRLLREVGVYGGAQGVWVDSDRTRGIDGAGGVTVSLLHTGRHYADELSADGVLYHYPRTGRPPGRDRSEVAATKAAGRLRLPLFVVTPGVPASSRNVHKGWIEGWDDDAEVFLVTFADEPPAAPPAEDGTSPFVLQTEVTRASRSVVDRPNQQRFKFAVLKLYGPACAVCDLAITELLQAAHLRRKAEGGSDDPRNGLVLCALHHLAYDRGLWAIEPGSLAVRNQPGGPDATQLRLTRRSLRHLPNQPHQDALRYAWSSWEGN
jgi:putative restriction endonuclease